MMVFLAGRLGATSSALGPIQLVDANGDMIPDIVATSSLGVTVAQTLLYQGVPDFFTPLQTCGDGVVSYGIEYCDALPGQSPWSGEQWQWVALFMCRASHKQESQWRIRRWGHCEEMCVGGGHTFQRTSP